MNGFLTSPVLSSNENLALILNNYSTSLIIEHDYFLADPIYQAILRRFLQKHPMNRRHRIDWLTDIFRDGEQVLFIIETPEFDNILKDESGTIFRHFLNGGNTKNFDLLRWISSAMYLTDYEMMLVAEEYKHGLGILH